MSEIKPFDGPPGSARQPTPDPLAKFRPAPIVEVVPPRLVRAFEESDEPEAKHSCGHSETRSHDCAYVDARNALIPQAEAYANAQVPSAVNRPAWEVAPSSECAWNLAFLGRMTELAKGLPA